MTKLKQYFPMIREKMEILSEIQTNPALSRLFNKWTAEQQEEFLNCCCGERGIKILYDPFFKEILNPEYSPERLESFLSKLLKQKIKILAVLPTDSTRIANESSLLIMDIVIQLEDESIANIEVQKVGYYFPGQRSACYSSDLLLRQYKRVRSEKKEKFSYRDIKNVYTIVLFENSPAEFKNYPDTYIHTFSQTSDSGLEIPLLQKYIFISLDIFKQIYHNKPISEELDYWLAFFSSETPEDIIRLIDSDPEFKPMYTDIYNMCLNMERVMNMFSEELAIMDRNTVQIMLEDMENKLAAQKEEFKENEAALAKSKALISKKDTIISEKDAVISEKDAIISEKDTAISEKDAAISEKDAAISEKEKALADQKAENEHLIQLLKEHNIEIN